MVALQMPETLRPAFTNRAADARHTKARSSVYSIKSWPCSSFANSNSTLLSTVHSLHSSFYYKGILRCRQKPMLKLDSAERHSNVNLITLWVNESAAFTVKRKVLRDYPGNSPCRVPFQHNAGCSLSKNHRSLISLKATLWRHALVVENRMKNLFRALVFPANSLVMRFADV